MSPLGERRVLLSGNRVQNKQILGTLDELGVSYLIVALSPDGKASVTDQIDGMRMLFEDVR